MIIVKISAINYNDRYPFPLQSVQDIILINEIRLNKCREIYLRLTISLILLRLFVHVPVCPFQYNLQYILYFT